ncbi:DUF1440 domain-containing protein [Flavobacterium aestivum]|uniref:DUF1440 domain-containing protein n=1 Tax=Flavobacterium aestivum TaxID=3003257 RepID=UPI0024821CF8|nr:DUF1440 domain-containing protein [Flavobacterium aestivum]
MKSKIKTIFLAGLVAGLLDGTAAVVFLGKMNYSAVFKFVASGLFGKSAFAGGNEMIIYGIIIHLLIAMTFAFLYYFSFSKISFFSKNKIIGGLLFGLLVWMIMNLLVLPFTNISHSPIILISAIKNILILMICVGLPISLIMQKQYAINE